MKTICNEFNSLKSYLINNLKVYEWLGEGRPYSNVNSGNILYLNAMRIGSLVTIRVTCTMDTGGNRSSTLNEFILPEGFRPRGTVYQATTNVTGNSYDNGTARWQINSEGKGTVQMDQTSYYERHVTFSYIAEPTFPSDNYLTSEFDLG